MTDSQISTNFFDKFHLTSPTVLSGKDQLENSLIDLGYYFQSQYREKQKLLNGTGGDKTKKRTEITIWEGRFFLEKMAKNTVL